MIFSDKLDSGGIRKVLEFDWLELEGSNKKILDFEFLIWILEQAITFKKMKLQKLVFFSNLENISNTDTLRNGYLRILVI